MFYPTAATPGAATIVKVASGEERSGVDMQLRVVPTAKVSGTVTGPAGTGLMQVQLRTAGADSDQSNIDVATTLASSNGGFTFLGVPSGNYVVRILRQPPPPIPAELASNPFIQMAMGSRTGGLQTMMYAQAPVNVSGSDITGLALTLSPGLTVSGRVVFDGTAPKPDANALVAISVSMASATQPGSTGAARVDPTGAFKTTGSLPGHYVINVGSPPGWVLLSVVADGHDLWQDGFDLTADVSGAVATFTDRAATVTGSVHASSGAVPENTTVYLLPANYETWIANGMSGRGPYSIGASSTGTYTIGRVVPGQYLLAAASTPASGAAPVADFYRALARGATKITIALGDHPNVDAPLVRIP
jgi:hypothetical protein